MITFLGQVCFEFRQAGVSFLIDPYFSHSVAVKENSLIERLISIPCAPQKLTHIDFVLLTHAHRDHCDLDTLLPLSLASPHCQFFGPPTVVDQLQSGGIENNRIHLVGTEPFAVKGVNFSPVPSAHPQVEVDNRGGWLAIGYVFETEAGRCYHPGDTAVSSEVISAVKEYGPIDVGMIPVNEINYYRNKDGIIGNMSVREAFQFAENVGVKLFIPTHWDMFAKNQVYKEEIQLLYDNMRPNFELKILDAGNSYES